MFFAYATCIKLPAFFRTELSTTRNQSSSKSRSPFLILEGEDPREDPPLNLSPSRRGAVTRTLSSPCLSSSSVAVRTRFTPSQVIKLSLIQENAFSSWLSPLRIRVPLTFMNSTNFGALNLENTQKQTSFQ